MHLASGPVAKKLLLKTHHSLVNPDSISAAFVTRFQIKLHLQHWSVFHLSELMTAYPMASWFETRGVAALLTMRV
jgi:hypothetical protein